MSEDEGFRRGARPRSDSSSSDGSVGPSNSRNKRFRVAVDSDSSSSSGGPVARRGRPRAAPLRDSESDTSGWATDHSDTRAVTAAAPPRNDGFTSDSSEGNSDKCSICLLRFTSQEIGTPQSCEHYFCLDCITEWSRNVNTCPVDRITFDAIVVKSCVGGAVLRTEPVKVAERRSSVDIVVVEEHTICELCNSAEGEETMLLCDGCDLGYHMACLEPPLITIPRGQWFCPNCISDNESVSISEVTDLLDELDDEGLAPRPLPPRTRVLRTPQNVRRSRRTQGADQPSSSRQRNSNITNEGSTSRSRKSRSTRQRVKVRRSRRDPTMLEYEVGSSGGKTKKKAPKRRKKRRQPRTAARRAMVRSCVRARLAALRLATLRDQHVLRTDCTDANMSRRRAGIQPLSIFGSSFELEYFGEEEDDGGGGGSVAMATRPTSHIISAYRQAQRKQITIPSPTHASTAPDILSSILESQSLLHSKGSIVSVSAGGQVNIKVLQKIRSKNGPGPQPNVSKPTENKAIASKEKADASSSKVDKKDDINKGVSDRVDLNKEGASVNVKETPMHPSQSRGGGFNHQNNYRGHGNFNNGGRHYDNNYGGDFNRNSQGNSFQDNVYNEGNSFESSYDRRPGFDGGFRPRRPNLEENRPFQRFNEPGRHSFGPPWQTSNQNRNQYQNNPRPNIEPRGRHSFGGFEDPLDMRTGSNNFQPSSSNNISIITPSNINAIALAPTNTNIPPLREPPAFKFGMTNTEVEKSEDENDGLVIDTEKYDPTEPTVDEESDNEDQQPDLFPDKSADITESITELTSQSIPFPPGPGPNDLDKPVNISAAVLDDAVRQVISQHSRLLTNVQDSDEEDTGDCPNFSIYSATSVHIAQTTNIEEPPAIETATVSPAVEVKKPADAYNEKISKKCPITPNTRTPIKIKINTPSLIKRVNLYDEEDEQEEEELEEPPKEVPKIIEVEEVTQNRNNYLPVTNEVSVADVELENVKEKSIEREKSPERVIQSLQIYDDDDKSDRTPIEDEKDSPIIENSLSNNDNYFKTPERDSPPSEDEKSIISNKSTKSKQSLSESDQGDESDSSRPKTAKKKPPLEKMTESISETEDERSYTPCLDENKKENSIEADALQGLDTEMISEDEGQDTFPEIAKEAGVIEEEEAPKPDEKEAPVKKKKKEIKEKKAKKKGESFKKSGKTKARNYRDKDKNRSRSPSHEKGDKGKSKREKRKDLERYDVRNVVSEKRRRKDAFGRDIISPRRSGSPVSPARKRRSTSPIRRSLSRSKRSLSRPRRSTSRVRRSISRARRSISRTRRSISRTKLSMSPSSRRSPIRAGRSISRRRSISRLKRSLSRKIRSLSRKRRSLSRKRVSPGPRRHSPPFRRGSMSRRRSRSVSRARLSPLPAPATRHKAKRRISNASPTRETARKKKRSVSPRRKSPTRKEKRRKENEGKAKPSKKKKRDRSQSKEKKRRNRKKSESPKRKSPKRKKKRRDVVAEPVIEVEPEWAWSGGSVTSLRPPSPLTPPAPVMPTHTHAHTHTHTHTHHRHRRLRDPPTSKEVFTSGDNILVSVSFKDSNTNAAAEERKRQRIERRLRRRALSTNQAIQEAKPVAIIDLERSPFREITPEAVNIIVVSDGEKSPDERREPVGPKTPPECAGAPPRGPPAPSPPAPAPAPPAPAAAAAQYDPFEPTRSPSISSNAGDKEVSDPVEEGLSSGPPEPDRLAITLETAQKTNMSADDVLDQRPISPIEKVMALLNSTRDVSLECVPTSSPPLLPATPPSNPLPAALPSTPTPAHTPTPVSTTTNLPTTIPTPTPRVLLPSPTRSSPLRPQPSKLFLAKPSPIKSTPIKPMPAKKISSLPLPVVRRMGEDSPYSPASSDFGELFSPPGGKDVFDALRPRTKKSDASKVPVKRVRKKGGKHQVPVQLGEDNIKILDDLPSSAVEMQVKSKFLKKLNRQERVVEEVKLVLKPYYNRRRLSKEDYKDIMRRAVPKICHNKHGEINPTKIQSLVEAYVKKLRKKRKLGLS